MAQSSLDIVSEYDKAEMNNAFAAAEKELGNRYDFKGTPAAIEWLPNKTGIKVTGASAWQVEAIVDIFRMKLAARGQDSRTLDTSAKVVEANLKATQEITFKDGLDKEKASQVTKILRGAHPKAKAQVQGEAVRVTSSSRDELQAVMATLKSADLDFPVAFTNFR